MINVSETVAAGLNADVLWSDSQAGVEQQDWDLQAEESGWLGRICPGNPKRWEPAANGGNSMHSGESFSRGFLVIWNKFRARNK